MGMHGRSWNGNVPARRVLSTKGLRIQSGRMERDFNNAGNNCWEDVIALAQGFDTVYLIWGQSKNAGGSTTNPNMLASVAVVGDPSNATADAATWANVQVGGAGAWPLAIGPAQFRRSFVISDPINIQDIPRTDGGKFPLLAVRSFVNGGTLTLWGDAAGNDHCTNWATKPSGRIWKRRRVAGNHASASQTTFTGDGGAACDESPLLGVMYVARGRVISVVTFGDSIGEGRGTYLGDSFASLACEELSDMASVAFEHSCLGWSGAAGTNILAGIQDFYAAGLTCHVAFIQSATPNDVTTVITDQIIANARFRLGQAVTLAESKGSQVMIQPWLPTNTGVATKQYGTSDAKRQAYAAEIEGRLNRGILVPALATKLGGAIDGTGQQQMAAGSTIDGIHPADAGIASGKDPVKTQLAWLI